MHRWFLYALVSILIVTCFRLDAQRTEATACDQPQHASPVMP